MRNYGFRWIIYVPYRVSSSFYGAIFLLITINLLNYFDKNHLKIIEVESISFKKSENKMENVVAAIALSLAMSENNPNKNIIKKNNMSSSNWLSNGQQRLFRSREV